MDASAGAEGHRMRTSECGSRPHRGLVAMVTLTELTRLRSNGNGRGILISTRELSLLSNEERCCDTKNVAVN